LKLAMHYLQVAFYLSSSVHFLIQWSMLSSANKCQTLLMLLAMYLLE
jgi:hypothetical protein